MKNKSFWWWLLTITTPLGVVGGALTTAALLNGLLSYNSFLEYLVNFWDDVLAKDLRDLLHRFAAALSIAELGVNFSNYLILGFLSYYSAIRAAIIVVKKFPKGEEAYTEQVETTTKKELAEALGGLLVLTSVPYFVFRNRIPEPPWVLLDWFENLFVFVGGVTAFSVAISLLFYAIFWPVVFVGLSWPAVTKFLRLRGFQFGRYVGGNDGQAKLTWLAYEENAYKRAILTWAPFLLFFMFYLIDRVFM